MAQHKPFFGGDYGDAYEGVPLASKGVLETDVAERFPATVAALEAVARAGAGGDAGAAAVGATRLAFFARQGPQSNVPPHSDMCNYLLTTHLGIVVPEGCALFFMDGGPPIRWENGVPARAEIGRSLGPRTIVYRSWHRFSRRRSNTPP